MDITPTTLLIWVLIFYVIAFIYIKKYSPQAKAKTNSQNPSIPIDNEHQAKLYNIQQNSHLLKKIPILNSTERKVFFRLQKAFRSLNAPLYIQPQVALGSYIKFDGNMSGLCSRCDFLVTDSCFEPICAIEINGSGHHTDLASKAMEVKRALLDSIAIPIYSIEIPNDYQDDALQITVNKMAAKIANSIIK